MQGDSVSEMLVQREDRNGIAILTLNRPKALNALSPDLFVELRAYIDSIAGETDQVGCVILRGEGRSFSAGIDIEAIKSSELTSGSRSEAATIDAIEALPQVVIASVQGHCYTGGLELALACDLLVASESAKFADTHGKWGMVPAWGMTRRLPLRVGMLKAREIMYTGRIISGRESAAIGLSNECVADDRLKARTLELAEQIVANSWHSLRGNKMLLASGMERHHTDSLQFERENAVPAPDMVDRLKSF